jgi:hypothetical protein
MYVCIYIYIKTIVVCVTTNTCIISKIMQIKILKHKMLDCKRLSQKVLVLDVFCFLFSKHRESRPLVFVASKTGDKYCKILETTYYSLTFYVLIFYMYFNLLSFNVTVNRLSVVIV